MSGLTMQRLTIPVTNEMASNVLVLRDLLRSQAAAQGVPPEVRPTAERRPKKNGLDWGITDYVYRWYVVQGLPEPESRSYDGFTHRTEWRNTTLYGEDNKDLIIRVQGLGNLLIEHAEELALELLAAAAEGRARTEMDMSEEDKKRSAEALRKAQEATDKAAKEQADKDAAVLQSGKGLTDG